jgi:hypothetical protein
MQLSQSRLLDMFAQVLCRSPLWLPKPATRWFPHKRRSVAFPTPPRVGFPTRDDRFANCGRETWSDRLRICSRLTPRTAQTSAAQSLSSQLHRSGLGRMKGESHRREIASLTSGAEGLPPTLGSCGGTSWRAGAVPHSGVSAARPRGGLVTASGPAGRGRTSRESRELDLGRESSGCKAQRW